MPLTLKRPGQHLIVVGHSQHLRLTGQPCSKHRRSRMNWSSQTSHSALIRHQPKTLRVQGKSNYVSLWHYLLFPVCSNRLCREYGLEGKGIYIADPDGLSTPHLPIYLQHAKSLPRIWGLRTGIRPWSGLYLKGRIGPVALVAYVPSEETPILLPCHSSTTHIQPFIQDPTAQIPPRCIISLPPSIAISIKDTYFGKHDCHTLVYLPRGFDSRKRERDPIHSRTRNA